MIALLISWFQIFWSSIFIDFHRFSSIFAKFDENTTRELVFFDQNPKTISTNVLVPSCISAAPPRFVWQNFAKRFHFCCSWLAKLWFLRKIDENRRKSMKIDENRWNSMKFDGDCHRNDPGWNRWGNWRCCGNCYVETIPRGKLLICRNDNQQSLEWFFYSDHDFYFSIRDFLSIFANFDENRRKSMKINENR